MIEYEGYVARVEFDADASMFQGRATSTGPYRVVTFESTPAGAPRLEFERLSINAWIVNTMDAR